MAKRIAVAGILLHNNAVACNDACLVVYYSIASNNLSPGGLIKQEKCRDQKEKPFHALPACFNIGAEVQKRELKKTIAL